MIGAGRDRDRCTRMNVKPMDGAGVDVKFSRHTCAVQPPRVFEVFFEEEVGAPVRFRSAVARQDWRHGPLRHTAIRLRDRLDSGEDQRRAGQLDPAHQGNLQAQQAEVVQDKRGDDLAGESAGTVRRDREQYGFELVTQR